MTFSVKTAMKSLCDNSYEGANEFVSCIMRWKLNDETAQPVEIRKESLFLSKESIIDICEFAKDKLIASTEQNHLLIAHDWKFIRKISDPEVSNTFKFSFTPFLGYDPESFPFILISGENHFSVINTETGSLDPLLNV